ncbi:unnamed protein product [Sphenostylis stenocarpa]|uniref:Uncharacterized protein n=1 Tax=Sphenostylis stenocarpa TaxID=92480 RepID=A0AA86W223_9FABA|nr:unnamed protein product [Sphenostylis stenocarpa]
MNDVDREGSWQMENHVEFQICKHSHMVDYDFLPIVIDIDSSTCGHELFPIHQGRAWRVSVTLLLEKLESYIVLWTVEEIAISDVLLDYRIVISDSKHTRY